MIKDSIPWKNDLLKVQNRFKKQNLPKSWTNRQYFLFERDIFVSFYVIRKLIESRELSRHIREKQISILKSLIADTPPPSLPVSHENLQKRYSNPAKKETISLWELCNQVIHSYHFALAHYQSKPIGFAFCSDREKDKCLYVLRFAEVSKLLKTIGSDRPKWIINVFDEKKRLWKRV